MIYQFVTGFPVAAAVAQSWNTVIAEEIGRAVSEEMEEYGVTWWLAPALNIVRNPLCGRNCEYYSEDPLLSGKFAAAITRGVTGLKSHTACTQGSLQRKEERYFWYSHSIWRRSFGLSGSTFFNA